jgi:hypothetical protein
MYFWSKVEPWRCHSSIFFNGSTAPWGPRPPHFSRLHDHTLLDTPHSVGLLWMSDQPVAQTSTWQHTTLTTDRHPCPPAGFEPTIPASERPQTDALDRAGTGIDRVAYIYIYIYIYIYSNIDCCVRSWKGLLFMQRRFGNRLFEKTNTRIRWHFRTE